MSRFVFLHDFFTESERACISVQDKGFLLGYGTFTTMLYIPSTFVFFDFHYERLVEVADTFQIAFRYTSVDVERICAALITRNQLNKQDAVIRMTLTRGVSEHAQTRGLDMSSVTRPTFLVTAEPYVQERASMHLSARLQLSSIRRNSTLWTTQYKTLNYLDAIFAREVAQADGFDDALFLNERGVCVCTTTANIFFVKNGCVITPPLSSGIVSGIVRAYIIKLCYSLGLVLKEEVLTPDELRYVDEVFITNSLIGVRPVCSIGFWNYSYNPTGLTQQFIQRYDHDKKYPSTVLQKRRE